MRESYLEQTECSMESVARALVLHMAEAEVKVDDVDEILNMLEITWAAARITNAVPNIDVYEAFDEDAVVHLVRHVLAIAHSLN